MMCAILMLYVLAHRQSPRLLCMFEFFCFVGTLLFGGGSRFSWPGIRVQTWFSWLFRFAILGRWLTHGDLVLEAQFDFIAVVQHWFNPARVRSEWAQT